MLFRSVANILIIPRMGITGAAIVAGLTEFLLLFLFFSSIRSTCGHTPVFSLIWKPVLSATGMAYFLTEVAWPLFPLIFTGMGVYFVLLLLLRAFNEHDFQVMRNILNREGRV